MHTFIAGMPAIDFHKAQYKRSNLSTISMVTPCGLTAISAAYMAVAQSHSASQMTRDPESKTEGEPV